MPDDMKKKMEAFLSAHGGKRAPLKPVVTPELEAAMMNFRQQFRTLCQDVVWPALRDTAALLRRHGHDSDLEEQEATELATGEKLTLNVRMRIFPAGFGRTLFQKHEPPYVCVLPEESTQQVRILSGTSLPGKERKPTANDYEIAQINREVIEGEVLGVLQTILAEEDE